MKDHQFYHVDVFRDLIEVLEELEDTLEQIPKSVKCFPIIGDMPHVHMDDTPGFRWWAKDHGGAIVPSDSAGYVKLLVKRGSISVYAVIPAEGAEKWGERL